MTRRRRPRTSEERLIAAVGSVARGVVGGRVRNVRQAPPLQRNTGTAVGGFGADADPIVIGLDAFASGIEGDGMVSIGNSADVEALRGVGIGMYATISAGADGGSIAIGSSSFVGPSGDGSVVVGSSASSLGGRAVTLGPDALSNGQYAVAIGNGPIATDDGVAIGNGAGAGQSVSIGTYAVSSSYAVSVGYNASNGSAMNSGAIMIGADTKPTNAAAVGSSVWTNMIAIGYSAAAGNDAAVAVGPNSRADGASSIALGSGAVATLDHQIMLGTSAETVVLPGNLEVTALPTADPGVSGLVWNNGGILTVSP